MTNMAETQVKTEGQCKHAQRQIDDMHEEFLKDLHENSGFTGTLAKTYNERTGGCNILLAHHLISLIKPFLPPASAPLRIHDNACGPLVLSNELFKDPSIAARPSVYISATDFSKDFINDAQNLIANTPDWNAGGKKIRAAHMNSMDLQFADETFDVSFTSLGIFAFPDPVKGASEIYRTLKVGGVAALTTWKDVGWMSLLHQVEIVIRPGEALTEFPFLKPWGVPGKLRQTLLDGGFQKVEETEAASSAWYESVDHAADKITDTLKLMVGKGWTEGEKERMKDGFVDVLSKGGEGVLKDGERVGFEMIAWAGVGWK